MQIEPEDKGLSLIVQLQMHIENGNLLFYGFSKAMGIAFIVFCRKPVHECMHKHTHLGMAMSHMWAHTCHIYVHMHVRIALLLRKMLFQLLLLRAQQQMKTEIFIAMYSPGNYPAYVVAEGSEVNITIGCTGNVIRSLSKVQKF